ncbi:MAG: EAL domain-containing protein [Lachnospiraceae bacterium]|nr:EAL domain-containing protein [Lachnospiraceae bacterium]
MLNGKKVIGVCVSKIHSVLLTEYVNALYKGALKRGYKLVVFNSTVDFYNNDRSESGSKGIFDIINYDIVDALVICGIYFYDNELLNKIIDKAKAHNIPTVLVKAESGKCISMLDDYRESFKTLINHVINEHNAKSTFFIAGLRENDKDSEIRIQCYKEVLAENGLAFSEDMIDYGDYWDYPTRKVVKRLLESGEKLPDAIICANDYMAFAVCDELEGAGYRVPDDIIVTGFDGVPESELSTPSLTTCAEDVTTNAEAIYDALESGNETGLIRGAYKPVYRRSCGCPAEGIPNRVTAIEQFNIMHDNYAHDEYINKSLDQMISVRDISEFLIMLPQWIMNNSFICINGGFITGLSSSMDFISETIADSVDIYESAYRRESRKMYSIKTSELIPDADEWVNDNTMYVFSPISINEDLFGYYALKTENIESVVYQMNRDLKAISISFNSIVSYYRQSIMLLGLKNAALIDHVTGLPNIKGLKQWFEEFTDNPENHKKSVTVSVYIIHDYRNIYERFGYNESERIIRVVTDALKDANKENCYVARSSENEFIVINYFDDPNDMSGVIDASVKVFYDELNRFREKSKYFFEVNAGCTELQPGWYGDLESLIKIAIREMYLNRLAASENNSDNQQGNESEQNIKSFELLIEKGLYDYHFQPIIDVKTAKICAYEALMRPDKSINMSPSEVVKTAAKCGRLYDVEKATMFSVLGILRERTAEFGDKKVFINSLPGYFLNRQDYDRFISSYSDLFGNLVIEITEESTASDNELSNIKNMIDGNTPVAIDDYGTGHSNIVNLLRYKPHIIKVDRFLITNIENDKNKQMFFRSTVEFAAMNNIYVLAEGVETSEELKCVISLGADLIQGFYTGRPNHDLLKELPEDISEEILMAVSERDKKEKRKKR